MVSGALGSLMQFDSASHHLFLMIGSTHRERVMSMGKTVDFKAWVDAREEASLDELVEFVRPYFEGAHHATYQEVPERLEEFCDAVRQIEDVMKGTSARITAQIDNEIPTLGDITIECRTFELNKEMMRVLAGFVAKEQNVDVMPMRNGNVQLSIGFSGLAKRLD